MEKLTALGQAAEGEANARLIAAAPDLYKALRDLTDATAIDEWVSPHTGRQILIENARAALAKARGEEAAR